MEARSSAPGAGTTADDAEPGEGRVNGDDEGGRTGRRGAKRDMKRVAETDDRCDVAGAVVLRFVVGRRRDVRNVAGRAATCKQRKAFMVAGASRRWSL